MVCRFGRGSGGTVASPGGDRCSSAGDDAPSSLRCPTGARRWCQRVLFRSFDGRCPRCSRTSSAPLIVSGLHDVACHGLWWGVLVQLGPLDSVDGQGRQDSSCQAVSGDGLAMTTGRSCSTASFRPQPPGCQTLRMGARAAGWLPVPGDHPQWVCWWQDPFPAPFQQASNWETMLAGGCRRSIGQEGGQGLFCPAEDREPVRAWLIYQDCSVRSAFS